MDAQTLACSAYHQSVEYLAKCWISSACGPGIVGGALLHVQVKLKIQDGVISDILRNAEIISVKTMYAATLGLLCCVDFSHS